MTASIHDRVPRIDSVKRRVRKGVTPGAAPPDDVCDEILSGDLVQYGCSRDSFVEEEAANELKKNAAAFSATDHQNLSSSSS